MESVLELKEKLQNVYAQYSTYIDKAVRFVLAFVAFFMINREIGYMCICWRIRSLHWGWL